jgi:hypothetical protein
MLRRRIGGIARGVSGTGFGEVGLFRISGRSVATPKEGAVGGNL